MDHYCPGLFLFAISLQVVVVYLHDLLQFADKAALSVSAVLGLYEDTGITGSEFSWLGSLFFLGHLAYQVHS